MTKNKTKATAQRNEDGFTLAELAIVLIISGMLTSIALMAYMTYVKRDMMEQTERSLERSASAIRIAQLEYGRYPCPADPTLAPEEDGYGEPDCDSPELVRRLGKRDLDNLDEDDNPYTNREADPMEIVLIGAVPSTFFTDLNLDGDPELGDNILALGAASDNTEESGYTLRDSIDGWGRKLTYAVSINLTDIDTDDDDNPDFAFTPDGGTIEVIDEGSYLGYDNIEELHEESTILGNSGAAHFVLISHGENGRGAFTRDGKLIGNCNVTIDPGDPGAEEEPPYGLSRRGEVDNCNRQDNFDARFIGGIRTTGSSDYNDDIVTFSLNPIKVHWRNTGRYFVETDDEDGGFFVPQISNTNSGKIGLGTEKPTQKLEVVGDIQAFEIHANQLCDSQGSGDQSDTTDDDCMLPAAIGGELEEMKCPDGEVAHRIVDNKLECYNPWARVTLDSCPARDDGTPTFITSISTDGSVTCATKDELEAAR